MQIEWTQGAIMFYGGVAGMVICLIAAVIAAVIIGKGHVRLRKKLDEEYGKGE